MTLDEALAALESDMDLRAAEPYVRAAADYLRASGESDRLKPVPRDADYLLSLVAQAPPPQGRPPQDVLEQVSSVLIQNCNWLYHPRCMGHQVSSPLPAAVWAESMTAALNQSMAVQEMSPVFTGIETGLVRWMAGLAGFPPTAGGVFTSGGTEATFTALLAPRRRFADAWEAGVEMRALW
jgi:L-2,4-diaminobutyrate decarboxylase